MKVLFIEAGKRNFYRPELFKPYTYYIAGTLKKDFGLQVTAVMPEKLYKYVIDRERPNLMLAIHGINVNPEIVRYARSRGVKTALWITEDPYEIDRNRQWAKLYDYIFTNELNAVKEYRGGRVYYMPFCTSPEVFKPVPDVEPKYRSDICFIGMGFPNRIDILNRIADFLANYNVKLVGNWTRWGGKLDPRLGKFVISGIVDPGEAVKYYNGARINLNIHRDYSDKKLPENLNSKNIRANSPNIRFFEICGCGKLQIVDNTRDISSYYIPGKEIVVYSDANDLRNKLRYYLDNPQEAEAIGKNARIKTLRCHTYKHRLGKMLNIIFGEGKYGKLYR